MFHSRAVLSFGRSSVAPALADEADCKRLMCSHTSTLKDFDRRRSPECDLVLLHPICCCIPKSVLACIFVGHSVRRPMVCSNSESSTGAFASSSSLLSRPSTLHPPSRLPVLPPVLLGLDGVRSPLPDYDCAPVAVCVARACVPQDEGGLALFELDDSAWPHCPPRVKALCRARRV